MKKKTFDLIVIGAGINGAAIAREAALHKLKVLVLDQGDLCSGTTGWSSRLIHGGLRYLEHAELSLVYESLAERERLLQAAPHLVQPLGLYIPIYRGGRRPPWQIRAGMILYDLLSWKKSFPRHDMYSVAGLAERLPSLNSEGLLGGAFYFDGQVTFPERLVVENLRDATDHGAELATYTQATSFIVERGRVRGLRWRNRMGQEGEARAAVIVNAAGPWVDEVLGDLGKRPFIGGTKGSHLVVDPFPGAPDAALYVEASSDGRPFFILPWNDLLLIGTTDQRYEGDPGEVSISDDELEYLVRETQRVFPQATDLRERVLYTQAGVRPLPHRPRGREGAITRRHIIRHHRRRARGLYSVIGGKLTTHRALAEDVMTRVAKRLGLRGADSPTRTRRLPGALPSEERDSLLNGIAARLNRRQADRLWHLYGGGATAIESLIGQNQQLATEICPHSGAMVAELIHALEAEHAVTLIDILQRRCMAGLCRDFGLQAAQNATDWLTRLTIWDAARAEQELADYRNYSARFRVRVTTDEKAYGGSDAR
jgi:glycerol-3-phosphate dehydrogenase